MGGEGAPWKRCAAGWRRSTASLSPAPGRRRRGRRALAALGRHDLSVARLAEGHVDARAILVELGAADRLEGPRLWGVWAAEPHRLLATAGADGWRLSGEKRWCSGADRLDRALVTATGPDGVLLLEVDVAATKPVPGSWAPMGMAATISETVRLRRRGGRRRTPWSARPTPTSTGPGSATAAAGWRPAGGAARLGVADGLHETVATEAGRRDEVAAALGTSLAALSTAGASLAAAAARIDEHPHDVTLAEELAAATRLGVEAAARTVLHETTAALGASGLCQRPTHSGKVADLTVYLSQLDRFRAAAAHGRAAAARPLQVRW